MKFINNIRFCWHLTKAEKALLKGNKKKYNKHAVIVKNILWNTVNEPK